MWLISGWKISGNDCYEPKWSFVEKRTACKDGHHLLIYALCYLYELYFLETADETTFFYVLLTCVPVQSCKWVQLSAKFCLIYLFHFCTCFGHPYAHHQEEITVSMWHWCLSLCMGGSRSAGWISIQPADLTPTVQSDKHQCRVDTVISSWWWTHECTKHVKKWNKYIKQNCAPSWTHLQDIRRSCKWIIPSLLAEYFTRQQVLCLM